MTRRIGNLEVCINKFNEVLIFDNDADLGIAFDECMAEKVCKYILTVAKKIREEQENG